MEKRLNRHENPIKTRWFIAGFNVNWRFRPICFDVNYPRELRKVLESQMDLIGSFCGYFCTNIQKSFVLPPQH